MKKNLNKTIAVGVVSAVIFGGGGYLLGATKASSATQGQPSGASGFAGRARSDP